MRTIATKQSTDVMARNNLMPVEGRSSTNRKVSAIMEFERQFFFAVLGSWLSSVKLRRLGVLPSGIPQILKHSSIA